ncbi:hypothetical protein HYV91_03755 [Candidatus Wolfebacteria bacterium]|nr:hypothetical protein [Candidatus Wolfebacteria bacterium]
MEKWLEWIWFFLDPLVATVTIFGLLIAVILGFGFFLLRKKPETLNRLLGIEKPKGGDDEVSSGR